MSATRSLALVLCVLAAAAAAATELYRDSFDDGVVSAEVQPVAAASLNESGGLLVVSAAAGSGVSFSVPTDAINCFAITLAQVKPTAPLAVGDRLTWVWIAVDPATGAEFSILESVWEQTGSSTFTTRKKNAAGETVLARQEISNEDLDVLPPAGQEVTVKWDRRTRGGVNQVQAEIVFVDAGTDRVRKYVKLFPWQDPDGFVSARIELVSSFEVELAFSEVAGNDEHQEVETGTGLGLWILLAVLAVLLIGLFVRRGRTAGAGQEPPERTPDQHEG